MLLLLFVNAQGLGFLFLFSESRHIYFRCCCAVRNGSEARDGKTFNPRKSPCLSWRLKWFSSFSFFKNTKWENLFVVFQMNQCWHDSQVFVTSAPLRAALRSSLQRDRSVQFGSALLHFVSICQQIYDSRANFSLPTDWYKWECLPVLFTFFLSFTLSTTRQEGKFAQTIKA